MSSRDNEESVAPIPNLKLPQYVFTLLQSKASSTQLEEAKVALLAGIEADGTFFFFLVDCILLTN